MKKTGITHGPILSMGALFNKARLYLDGQFKTLGLTRPEWLILALLSDQRSGVSQLTAKAVVAVENSYFTKVLNQLEDKGYIIREIDPADRRNRLIKPNPKFQQKLETAFKILRDFNNTIEFNISAEQMAVFNQILVAIDVNLSGGNSRK